MTNLPRSLSRLGLLQAVALLAMFSVQAAQTASGLSMQAASDSKRDKGLRAAAEPFENLTEISFSAAWPTIDQTIRQAEAASRRSRGVLSETAASELDEHLAALRSARQKRDRAGLALSSIEVYRVLVSAVKDNARIPIDVNLLDYAGFRYQADLKASPIRWDDMARAVSFARKRWEALPSNAKASPVGRRFEMALADMDKAAAQKNHSMAASSVKIELELVDQLEHFFSTH